MDPGELLVLDPEELVQYARKRKRLDHDKDLACSLKTVPEVRLVPGKWQDRCAVLKWRVMLAAWRKQRARNSSTNCVNYLLKDTEHPPPAYCIDLPPAYEAREIAPE